MLLEGLDDYTGIWALAFAVEEEMPGSSPEEIREAALEIVEDLLSRGLVVGGFPRGHDFEPLGLGTGETLARVRRDWDALGERRSPDVGEGIWFDLTDAGEEYARKLNAAA
jgi:hypothetical protein